MKSGCRTKFVEVSLRISLKKRKSTERLTEKERQCCRESTPKGHIAIAKEITKEAFALPTAEVKVKKGRRGKGIVFSTQSPRK